MKGVSAITATPFFIKIDKRCDAVVEKFKQHARGF
jgi:hypothetical protein